MSSYTSSSLDRSYGSSSSNFPLEFDLERQVGRPERSRRLSTRTSRAERRDNKVACIAVPLFAVCTLVFGFQSAFLLLACKTYETPDEPPGIQTCRHMGLANLVIALSGMACMAAAGCRR
jgi:hypothetical protein